MAIDQTLVASPPSADGLAVAPRPAVEPVPCFHCGSACASTGVSEGDRVFCCAGCLTVHGLLTEHGLGHFYELGERAGIRTEGAVRRERFAFLDEPAVFDRLVDFREGHSSRVTLQVPAIHCVACVWLLENLFRLRAGIGRSRVDFARREVTVTFEPERLPLSELAALMASMGYAPELNLGSLESGRASDAVRRRLWLQIGVAGFVFGNTMLLSLPVYFGLDSVSGPGIRLLFGWLSVALAVPVVAFSAADYWRSAWFCLRQRILTIELPIAAGLAALFGQSVYEVASGRGEGYFDSLSGLVFFLLVGRMFQHKTYARLNFDRDYKAFFPLSVVRRTAAGDGVVPISAVAVGDRLVIRHGELVPADARLVSGRGLIDYSFVTGESAAVERHAGELVFAGGQQTGGETEVETLKPVSQSYLTSLWAHESFRKERGDPLDTILNRYSRRFTVMVAAVAVVAAVWWWVHNPPIALKAFTSVLIVACPCALALSAPFALGTAQRLLARGRIFLKNPQVLETLARVDTVVFDKTGTLTSAAAARAEFDGAPLTSGEAAAVAALARQSTHPQALAVAGAVGGGETVDSAGFREEVGLGIEGQAGGLRLRLGSADWLKGGGVVLPAGVAGASAGVCLAVDGAYRGRFVIDHGLRPELDELVATLAGRYRLVLLSGDNDRERARFGALLGPEAGLHFNQSPGDKLELIRGLKREGRTVMMVGDGLNDAGALRESDVGVAVVERVGAFSPASDLILEAGRLPVLGRVIPFARGTVRVVWWSIGLSGLYNAVGLGIAAGGLLSPAVCAILMPLSSISVVAFACGATRWRERRVGLAGPRGRGGPGTDEMPA